MIFSKFFFKHFSFLKNIKKKTLFFKSKNSHNPFRLVLHTSALGYFCVKNNIFDNVKIYKNFDTFNKPYYTFFLRNKLKSLH